MTSQRTKEIKATQARIELIATGMDAALKVLETLVRNDRQDIAEKIADSRHAIKGALNLPLNALALLEVVPK